MIGESGHIQKPFTHTTAKLNRLRNQEHSLMYRLPPELLVEILLLAVDWSRWSVGKLRALASVSTSWRDNILSCNRFWSVMDVLATEQARGIAMKRNPEGPVDLWCKGSPSLSALKSFINDVETINQTRLRSVVFHRRPYSQWRSGRLYCSRAAVVRRTHLAAYRYPSRELAMAISASHQPPHSLFSKPHVEGPPNQPSLRHFIFISGT